MAGPDRSVALHGTLSDYVALTRPRVLLLVLLTGPPAMAMGDGVWPDPLTFLLALAGTALLGAGCGALNAWYERDRDARMARTCDRPLPAGRLTPRRALAFGLLISGMGLWTLVRAGGWLPAAIGLGALLHYVVVYTIWLKPRSPNAVVVGGVSGAIAPLIADAAVHQSVGLWGWVLFAIVFVWQPPHFWAIALRRKEEYGAAGFPTLPSIVGDRRTRRRMLGWAIALVPVTLVPWLGGALGPVYASVAALVGAGFIVSIVRAMRAATPEADRGVFLASIASLGLLFAAMLGELLVRQSGPGILRALPHVSAVLNAGGVLLLIGGLVAIRMERRELHRRLMLTTLLTGIVFLVLYLVQVALLGHRPFPGEGTLRVVFLGILGTHTLLAIAVVPLVLRSLFLAMKQRFVEHRRIVRFAYPVWLYVSVTGVVIYWMGHHLLPR